MLSKKKKFPKFKKKLKWFLTDESWKISKKSAIWVSASSIFLSGIQETSAWTWFNWPQDHLNGNVGWNLNITVSAICNHSSGLINGHYSWIPSIQSANIVGHGNHTSY